MGNLKNSSHLRSARKWLMRAEEAFDNECEIRGELDLLLARAELQHVGEAKSSGRWWHKYRLIMNCAAFVLALLVAVVGMGGVHFMYSSNSYDIKSAEEQKITNASQSVILRNINLPVNTAGIVPKTDNQSETREILPSVGKNTVAETSDVNKTAVQAAAEPGAAKAAVKESTPIADKTVAKTSASESVIPSFSQSEMQKLVRAAGKSLIGGQTIGKSEGGNE